MFVIVAVVAVVVLWLASLLALDTWTTSKKHEASAKVPPQVGQVWEGLGVRYILHPGARPLDRVLVQRSGMTFLTSFDLPEWERIVEQDLLILVEGPGVAERNRGARC